MWWRRWWKKLYYVHIPFVYVLFYECSLASFTFAHLVYTLPINVYITNVVAFAGYSYVLASQLCVSHWTALPLFAYIAAATAAVVVCMYVLYWFWCGCSAIRMCLICLQIRVLLYTVRIVHTHIDVFARVYACIPRTRIHSRKMEHFQWKFLRHFILHVHNEMNLHHITKSSTINSEVLFNRFVSN